MFYTIRKFVSLPKIEQKILIETLLTSLFVKVLMILLSFKLIEKKIINKTFKKNEKRKITEETIYLIKKSIQRVSRFVFWRNKCIEQSLTALIMLKKRKIPYTLYMGVRKYDGKMHAHVWIRANSTYIVEKGNAEFIITKEYSG